MKPNLEISSHVVKTIPHVIYKPHFIIWPILQVVTNTSDEIANRAIELLKEVSTNLGPKLQQTSVHFHENFISECLDRLIAHHRTVKVLHSQTNNVQNSVLATERS